MYFIVYDFINLDNIFINNQFFFEEKVRFLSTAQRDILTFKGYIIVLNLFGTKGELLGMVMIRLRFEATPHRKAYMLPYIFVASRPCRAKEGWRYSNLENQIPMLPQNSRVLWCLAPILIVVLVVYKLLFPNHRASNRQHYGQTKRG